MHFICANVHRRPREVDAQRHAPGTAQADDDRFIEYPFTSWRAILSLSLRPRDGVTKGYLDHEQQSAAGSRAPGPELEGMIRGGGGGAAAAAAVAHQLMQNPLVGAVVLLVLVAAVWWVWNKYF